MQIFFFKHAKLERVTKFGTRERESWYAKKSFEKARGNAEREEEMKERGHASREGPAGTRPALLVGTSSTCRFVVHKISTLPYTFVQ